MERCAADGVVPSAYVFTGADGGRLSPDYLTRSREAPARRRQEPRTERPPLAIVAA